ncbi:MAG: hypothetical protein ACJAYU_002671, partial [Bradymonadia bacterium]
MDVVPFDETSAAWMRANEVYPGAEWGIDLTGDTVTLGIFDGGGLFTAHDDLVGRGFNVGDDYVDNCIALSSHSTAVSTAAMGLGSNDVVATGIAPGVDFILGWTFCDDAVEKTRENAAFFEASNHSYGSNGGWVAIEGDWYHVGSDLFGKYDSEARRADLAINETDEVWVYAAGNQGNEGPDSPEIAPRDCGNGIDCLLSGSLAKNAIVVAGVRDIEIDEETGARNIVPMGMSSRGPADDGRVKPDVGARGRDVRSAALGDGTTYSGSSGTSLAAPAVTGGVALLTELYHRHRGGSTPESAMIRGLLIHTAESIYGEGEPDPALGHGLMDLAEAAEVLQLELTELEHRVARAVHGRRDRFKSWFVTPEDGEALVVSIAWNDPAGESNFRGIDDPTPSLVNDLDLTIIGPDGSVYYPWSFDPADRLARATRVQENHVDNAERVWIAPEVLQAGEYEIRVRASDLYENLAQPYYVFSSHDLTGDDETPLRAAAGEGVVVAPEQNSAEVRLWAAADGPEVTFTL